MILGICKDPDVLSVMKLVKLVINILKIGIPIMLIISCMIDAAKGVISADVNEALKGMKSRIIAAVLIFCIPTFVSIMFNVLDKNKDYYACLENATTEGINTARINKTNDLILLSKNTLLEDYYHQAKSEIKKITTESDRKSLTTELDAVYKEIEAAKKQRQEREQNSHAATGTYTKTEMMDLDEQTVKNMSHEEFIDYVASMAQDIYHEYGGVLPSITIAQACYESGWGKHFEVGSHNLYGLIGYPSDKPKVNVTRKFENFYEATYYHYKYFEVYNDVYASFLQRCKEKDAIGAASYLPAYAGGQSDYGTTVQAIIRENDLTRFDN